MLRRLDDVSKFGKMVKLVSFVPFKDAAHALEVMNDVSEGEQGFIAQEGVTAAGEAGRSIHWRFLGGMRRREEQGQGTLS